MPYRSTFDCLWCGRSWTTRGPDDIEGYARLCPDCIGRAGDNGFLRFRLKAALEERATSSSVPVAVGSPPAPTGSTRNGEPSAGPGDDLEAEMIAYYEARAGEYDDWYLRRGRYERGPIHDLAWSAELDQVTRWLDGLPLSGEIVELAAGTGWWSPLLASKGELSVYDAAGAPLDRARERLLAHGLRAHIHVRDAWAEPDRQVDGLFVGFWLSHLRPERLEAFLGLAHRWLKPGGLFAFVDSRRDPQSGAADQPPTPEAEAAAGIVRRRLADGREFQVVKVIHEPARLEAALWDAGFAAIEVTSTARFFVLGRGTAADPGRR